jgi:hypothetical protein
LRRRNRDHASDESQRRGNELLRSGIGKKEFSISRIFGKPFQASTEGQPESEEDQKEGEKRGQEGKKSHKNFGYRIR